MRQVDLPELEWLLTDGLREVPRSLMAMLNDRRPEQQRQGRALVAQVLAARFARLEILSSAPGGASFRQVGDPPGVRPRDDL